MAPKFDPNEIVHVYIRQVGGDVGASTVLSRKVAPLGMNAKKVGEDIAKMTQAWKGIKITVQVTVQNRQAEISVVPTSTSMIIKELKEPLRDRKKVKNIKHNGNITLKAVINIARTMRSSGKGILSRTLSGTVKEVLGTCNAVGCTVDGKKPTEVQQEITDGIIDIPEE